MDELMRLLLENVIELAAAVTATVLTVALGRLAAAAEKTKRLQAVNAARSEAEALVRLGVDALQQTMVDGLKAAAEDGKLTREEIAELGEKLLRCVGENLSAPAEKLLRAARVDLTVMVKTAAEAYLLEKREQGNG